MTKREVNPSRPLIDLQRRAVAAANETRNAHDARRYAELFTRDATVSEYGLGEVSGHDAIAAGMQAAFNGFPDFKIGLSAVFVKDDLLVEEWIITGTNTGEFNGAKPTNKAIGVHGASVLTFSSDGLIKSERRYFDTRTLVSQLGMMEGDGEPIATLPSADPPWHIASAVSEDNKMIEIAKASLYTPAFPDAKTTYDAIFSVGDAVISVASFTATHAGALGSLQPTNKVVTLHAVDIMSVRNDKVESGTTYWNSFELLGQEGLLPKPDAK